MKGIVKVFALQFIIFLVVILSISAFHFYELYQFRNKLEDSSAIMIKKEKFLSDLKGHIGYGGGIHAFKNYLLRNRRDDHRRSFQEFQAAKYAIGQYRMLPQYSDEEGKRLDVILSTIDQYLYGLKLLENRKDGDTIIGMDRSVKIDDGPAVLALKWLGNRLGEQRLMIRSMIDRNLERTIIHFVFTVLFAIVAIIIFMIFSFRKINVINSKLETSNQLLEESWSEIYIFDQISLKFIYTNRGAVNNLGHTQREMYNMTPLDIKPEFDYQQFYELIAPLRLGKKDKISFSTTHRRKDGSDYYVQVDLQKTSYMGVDAYIAMILDVSEQEKSKREREQLIEDHIKEQHIINNLLRVDSTTEISLNEKLHQAMLAILEIPWIALKRKAGVFLVEGRELKLVESVGLSDELLNRCGTIRSGECLCGQALELKRTIHSSQVDHLHSITYKDMEPHGHYNVPIKHEEQVLGVIVLYLPDRHPYSDKKVRFLESCADIIAKIIIQHRSDERLIAFKEVDAINAMIVTYNHEINTPMTVIKGAVAKLKKDFGEGPNLARIDNSADKVIRLVEKSTLAAQQDDIQFDQYTGDTKMVKIKSE